MKIPALAGAVALACIAAPAHAEWQNMNDIINQTNFIVANQCSGTLISLKYKLVLTNNHCLEGYVDKVEKDETGPSGKVEKVTREVFKPMALTQKAYKNFEEVGSSTYQAKILFHAPKYDLAILQIRADGITQTMFSRLLPPEKKVQRGDPVYVVGNPYMLDANLTEGHVSSINRTIKWEDGETIPYFGVDAGVNPGNSGGALYDAEGDLIGVPAAAIHSATGLGFAIPYTVIRTLLTDHCYEDVWNPAAKQDHDACEKGKLDKENELRAKAGMPAKEMPKDDVMGAAGEWVNKANSLVMPRSPAPALHIEVNF